jgi:hypothetical protein
MVRSESDLGWRGRKEDPRYGMSNEKLSVTMTSHIHCTHRNHSLRTEDQESETIFLCLGLPAVGSLEVLEGIDEEELGD